MQNLSFSPEISYTPRKKTSPLSTIRRSPRFSPYSSPSKPRFDYKYKNQFQEEFRNGDFEANEQDLANLQLDAWVPIMKHDIDKIKTAQKPKPDPIEQYFDEETLDILEEKVIQMITDAYLHAMPSVCPHLIENQKILANYRRENKIKYGQEHSPFKKSTNKQKLINQIQMIQNDLEDVEKRNQQLRNHIDLLQKAKDQAILARDGIIAQAIYTDIISTPSKSQKVLIKFKTPFEDT